MLNINDEFSPAHPGIAIGHVPPQGAPDGGLTMHTRRLDLEGLLREAQTYNA